MAYMDKLTRYAGFAGQPAQICFLKVTLILNKTLKGTCKGPGRALWHGFSELGSFNHIVLNLN